MAWLIAICFAVSIVASLVLVPLVRRCAHGIGMVDRPDGERKLHREPVALGGGLAVYLALVVAFVSTILIDRTFFGRLLGDVSIAFYILFGTAAALLIIGLIDDAWSLRGRQKLLLQCLILCLLVGSGTLIRRINILGVDFELGILAFPLTVTWLLLSVNALNLIDGADGMATTAGCVISAGLGLIGLYNGSWLSAVIAFSLAAALAVFLLFNRPPASIFLGDAGSMTIGLFVGVLAVWSSVKESTMLASAPVAILAIPLFDSTAAILRRWLTGRSIYTTDRAHLHHLLLEKFGPIRMLLIVAGLCITTTVLAVLSVVFQQPWLAVLGVVFVTTLLILTRSFGHAEATLLMGRAVHFAQSFAVPPTSNTSEAHHLRTALQGVEKWDSIWEPLVEFAEGHGLAQVKIDLNLAWLHEGYHATWQSVRLPEKSFQLQISIPLLAHRSSDQSRVTIGRLEVVVSAKDPRAYERIADLCEHLNDLSLEVGRVVAKLEHSKNRVATVPLMELPVESSVQHAVEIGGLPVNRPCGVAASQTTLAET